jgi:hypothetical protein
MSELRLSDLAAARALVPVLPRVTFHEVAGGVAVMVGGEPLGWITREQAEELERRFKEKP